MKCMREEGKGNSRTSIANSRATEKAAPACTAGAHRRLRSLCARHPKLMDTSSCSSCKKGSRESSSAPRGGSSAGLRATMKATMPRGSNSPATIVAAWSRRTRHFRSCRRPLSRSGAQPSARRSRCPSGRPDGARSGGGFQHASTWHLARRLQLLLAAGRCGCDGMPSTEPGPG